MTRSLDISLFNKILILVEDKGRVTLRELEALGHKRQTLGALGRLEGLQYIERIKNSGDEYFVLTEKGDATIAAILEYLPSSTRQWDEKWRIIVFDIPESKRTVRQMFRLKLIDLGARMLQSSVWITPYESVVSQFGKIIGKDGFGHSVQFFEAKPLGLGTIDVAQLWELEKLNGEYQQLFNVFQRTFPRLKKSNDASFLAKCMIVHLALVAKKDPALPPELMPKNWIGFQAEAWYQKIRVYCQ